MTSQEIIDQIENATNFKVVGNPFIRAFCRLQPEKKEAVAEQISINDEYVIGENNHVNISILLPYLWLALTLEQKKILLASIHSLINEYGIKILDLFPKSDIEFIFTEYDFTKLTWQWKDVQTLLNLLSEGEIQKHIKRYIKPYISPFKKDMLYPEQKFKLFLDKLTEEECYWLFMKMDHDHFMTSFARVDFLFGYLSSKHRVELLSRVSSPYIFKTISAINQLLWYEKFKIFLRSFDIEDRTDVLCLMDPKTIQEKITLIITLLHTLEEFSEPDRLLVIKFLGYEYLINIFSNDHNSDFHILLISKKLPLEHRIIFLMEFDPLYLQQTYNNVDKIADIINILPTNDFGQFLWQLNLNTSSMVSHFPEFLQQVLPEKRFFCITEIAPIILKQCLKNAQWDTMIIEVITRELPEERRLDFLLYIHKLFPGFVNKICLSNCVIFGNITSLLLEKNQFSFFNLLPEKDLRLLYENSIQYQENESQEKLQKYLEEKSLTRPSSVIKLSVPNPANSAQLHSPLNQTLDSSPFKNIQHSSIKDEGKLTCFQKLDAKIYLLENRKFASKNYKALYNSLLKLKKAATLQDYKESRSGNNKESQLINVINSTVHFLDDFLSESNPQEKHNIIRRYEKEIQPAKTLKNIGKHLAIIIISSLCIASGVMLGVGIGLLAGSWTGPGAIVTGFAGLLTGLTLASGACYAGLTFFGASPVEKAIGDIIDNSKKIEKELNDIEGDYEICFL